MIGTNNREKINWRSFICVCISHNHVNNLSKKKESINTDNKRLPDFTTKHKQVRELQG